MSNIRAATPNDVGQLRALHEVARSPVRGPWTEGRVDAGCCFVAVLDDKIIGYIIFDHSFFLNGFIEMLFVHPDHRHKGIASSLINHAQSLCKTDRLFSTTNQSNQPMHKLMAKLGYLPCGIIDLDPGDPEVVYVKKLNA